MSVWSAITKLSGAQGVLAAWGEFPTQFLTVVDGLAGAIPCDRGHSCDLRIVEHTPDDVVGVCSTDDGLCESRQVSRRERVVFRLDEQKLFDTIIQAVGGKGMRVELVASQPRVCCIGGLPTIGDAQLPVFFALSTDLMATKGAITALLARGEGNFLLVVPEEKAIGIVQQDRATQRGSRIMGLDQLLEVNEKDAVSVRASGQEVLKAWLGKSVAAPARDAEGARFPTPPGTTWKDITITFLSRDNIEIKCGKLKADSKERSNLPGMVDTTKLYKTPTDKWFLLMAFASRGPALSMNDLERFYVSTNRLMIKKQKSDLSAALRAYFGIKSEPIPYKRHDRCYRPELTIRQAANVDLEVWLEDWLTDR